MTIIFALEYLVSLAGLEAPNPEALTSLFRLLAFFAFWLGISIGSFLNVCIYRMPLYGRSISKPKYSFCFTCGTTLKWYDNLPLVTYLWLMGRCRYCGSVYSSRYFWIELFCGLLYLGLFLHFGPSLAFLMSVSLGSLLIVVVFTDLDEFVIPDQIPLTGAIIGLVLSLSAWWIGDNPLTQGMPVTRFWQALAGGILGAGILWSIGWISSVVLRKDAMGFGDVTLLGMMGIFIGPINIILTIFIASCIGSIIGLSQKLILTLQKKRKYAHIPFGPYLALGGFLTLFIGPWMWNLVFPPENVSILKEMLFGS